ncbi:putative oxidoreductase [Sulfolobales archaeon HS-7]|nr:putative oxidoreductase [Sulfolobales archaeon HS-7]
MKVAVVTGGAKGIGSAVTERLAQDGYLVVIADIDEDAGKFREKNLREKNLNVVFKKTDVSDEMSIIELKKFIDSAFGRVDALINNAGIASFRKPFFEQSIADWQKVIGTNLTGTYLCSRHLGEIMSRTGGVIVNMASTRAFQSEPFTEPYSASKGGVIALTHAMAVSLSRYGIRVVAISPGWIDTSRYQYPPHESDLSPLDHKQHLTGRVGNPEDVANLISFLCSEKASWISGVNFTIDGGMSVKMIYLDEEVLSEAIGTLTGSEEFSEEFKRLLKLVREGKVSVQEIKKLTSSVS